VLRPAIFDKSSDPEICFMLRSCSFVQHATTQRQGVETMHTWIPVLLAVLAPQEPDMGKLVSEAKLGMTRAVELGMREAKTGVPVHVELEFEKGRAVWSLDIAQGNKLCEVLLDARDGSVVERAEEDEDWSKVVAAARLTVPQAVAAVVEKNKGTPVNAELLSVDGVSTASVELFASGKKEKFLVKVVVTRKQPGSQGQKAGRHAKAGAREEEEEEEEGEEREATKRKGTAKATAPSETPFTDRFGESRRDLGPTGRNPYFVLVPGYRLVLEGEEHGKAARIVIKVLDETKEIGGIEARVVEERESVDGQLKEITRDYFAISKRTNNVYYLGEEVDVYRDGKVVNHDGAWLHGKGGARFGLMMPGTPLLGARYQQETAPGVAMDRARVVSLSGRFTCPAGRFHNVLLIEESTPLESGTEQKRYAQGVGLLQDGNLKLVRYGMQRMQREERR
jgi:Peptidase propeptide and YPEB domain